MCRFISLDEQLDECITEGRKYANDQHNKIFNPAPPEVEKRSVETPPGAVTDGAADNSNGAPAIKTAPKQPVAVAPSTNNSAAAIEKTPTSAQSSITSPEKQLEMFGQKIDAVWPQYVEIWKGTFGSLRLIGRVGTDLFNWVLAPNFSPKRISQAMLSNPVLFFLIIGLWIGLIGYVDAQSKFKFIRWPIENTVLGTLHFIAHLIFTACD